jgi:regulator of protease activity HflC (stomatin/prohibitin superfamily)
MALPLYIFLAVAAFILISGIRVLIEYERGVVFFLGRYVRTAGPGLIYILPFLERMQKVDMRLVTADIPKNEVITKDNIQVNVNTVVYFKVKNPEKATIEIEDYEYAVQQYTQAALRDVIGNAELDFLLTEREKIAAAIKKIVDKETDAWGVDIETIKIQEIELPQEMKRAIARQAEAEREKRAVIITAEGELKASENLRKAAENLSKNAGALQLRTLQTIRDIASSPSQKIVIFAPGDLGNIVSKLLK